MKRLKLLLILAAMPSEAFSWISVAIEHTIYPSGIGGFQRASQVAIREAIAEASILNTSGGDL